VNRELSIVLYLKPLANPVTTLNSLYKVLQSNLNCELILIAEEKDAYQYDTLMEKFPVLRVILPERKLTFAEVLEIGCRESFSNHVMFLDDTVLLENLPTEIFSLYYDDPQYGIMIPQLFNEKNEGLPSQIKCILLHGFIQTVGRDKPQTAAPGLYPPHFCFILNKTMFLERDFHLYDYENFLYTLAEIGWRVWKSDFWVIQVRQWRVVRLVDTPVEMEFSPDDEEYLLFHARNIVQPALVRKQNAYLFSLLIQKILTLHFKHVRSIWQTLFHRKKFRSELEGFPLEDMAIFSIINKENA
jgi:hypothetical protein